MNEFLQSRIADLALNLPAPEARRLWARVTGPGFFDAAEAAQILEQVDLARWQAAQQGGHPRGRRAA
jgi:hypothetical protein